MSVESGPSKADLIIDLRAVILLAQKGLDANTLPEMEAALDEIHDYICDDEDDEG